MENVFLEVKNLSLSKGGQAVLHEINFTILKGEQWAIIGASGSGKTSLAQALSARVFYSGEVKYFIPQHSIVELVEQQHRFKTLNNTSDFYYQQRYNSSDAENSLKVQDLFNAEALNDERLLTDLHVDVLLHKPLIQLSNGENKRVQLARVILKHPAVVILDNPFIGLDVNGRAALQVLINTISSRGIQVIIVSSPTELPSSITHVAVLQKGRIVFIGRKDEYHESAFKQQQIMHIQAEILDSLKPLSDASFNRAIDMRGVTVTYEGKTVLDNINWTVNRGECWSLSGSNGAGKSTLLSLINGDNPQAYANEIYLFDRRRGSGESIWDIKKNIGYVSPELHLFFDTSSTVFTAVASGLFDTVGLFRSLSTEQESRIQLWLKLLGIESLGPRFLHSVSGGQQRLVMLARALVKNPPLLILDEPCQGLDDQQSEHFRFLIETICEHFGTTLIYVSHYQHDIPSCVQHFIRLDAGMRVQ